MTTPLVTYEACVCPWCGHTPPRSCYPDLHVVDCARCGLRFASPRPTATARETLYTRHYFESHNSAALGYDNYEADRPQLFHTFRRRLQEIQRTLGRTGTLLDVGCATGIAVEAALQLGWNAEGIDVSAYAVSQGCETHKLPLSRAQVEDWQSELVPYDVVTMWDYLEHVPDPRGTLIAAASLLRPGGLLVLTTPDSRSWPARVFRKRWMGYKRDEHLVYFNIPHLRAFLREAGFSPLYRYYVGKHISLQFFAERLLVYSPLLGHVLNRLSRFLGMQDTVVYVNPCDIVFMVAKRNATTGP